MLNGTIDNERALELLKKAKAKRRAEAREKAKARAVSGKSGVRSPIA